MNLTYFEWIWCIKGKMPVEATEPPAQVLSKVESLLGANDTNYRIDGDTLTFTKKNAVPQDKLSVFDRGTLRVSNGVFHYHLVSKALLACFFAPLFFFVLGHAGVAMDQWRNPPEVVKAKQEAAKKRSLVKPEDVPMSAIDKFLGAPTPEKKKTGEEIGKRNRKPSMETAYNWMGIFFALWIAGRILEHKLVHNLFRKKLAGEQVAQGNSVAQAPDMNLALASAVSAPSPVTA